MLLHDLVENAASARPDDLALVSDGRRLSFSALAGRVRRMSELLATGRAGDRVAVVADNHLDVVTALYAVPRRGGIVVPGNTRHTADELAAMLRSVTPSTLLSTPEQLDRLAGIDLDPSCRVLAIGGSHGRAEADLTALLDRTAGSEPGPAEDDPEACAWLIHTSGTTGRAKAAMLTHRSLLAAVTNTAIARPFDPDDVYLFPFPLFHVAAYNVLHAHLRGRPVVLVPRFDAERVIEAIREHGVTSCSLAPTMISMLLDRTGPSHAALRSLRQISYGASSMPRDLLLRVLDELPDCGLAQGYGMTELSGNAVFLDPAMHRRAAGDAPHLLAAAGRPGPLVSLRIEGTDGDEVGRGEVGEILVRGDQVVPGYWNDPDATARARTGEWLRTGDLGRLDGDGVLYVVDRKKDVIITGGENVGSREVEDVLSTHPRIGQVAVVGVPDERWGEMVCAVVVPSTVADEVDGGEIVEWTRGRLAGFKRPRRVVTVDALPLNASGKVDKRLVRELLARSD